MDIRCHSTLLGKWFGTTKFLYNTTTFQVLILGR
uniref:Uncharacterized protein n=1 Tax=Arundo donax TaxID=35708 RepID=A0A0A9ALJ1_ARUDO